MTDEQVPATAADPPRPRKPAGRRRWATLAIPLVVLGSLLWVSNWFYQRSRLFRDSNVVLGDPFLLWEKLIDEDTARELFGVPVDLSPNAPTLTPYQVRLIGSYTPLKSLQLRGMSDADVRRLSGLVNLERLSLDDSPITDDACQVIGQFRNLRRLHIRGSESAPSAITERGLEALTDLDQLKSLSLYGPSVTDAGLEWLGELESLEILMLVDATIHGEGLDQLSRLGGLQILSLLNCPLEGDCLCQLADCHVLNSLHLEDSTVTDEMLPSLIPVKSIRHVHLFDTKVTRDACLRLKELRPDIDIWDAEGKRIVRSDLGTP